MGTWSIPNRRPCCGASSTWRAWNTGACAPSEMSLGRTACRHRPAEPIWDIQAIRKLLKRDLYRPHSFEELRRAGVSEEVLRGVGAEARCGLYYFGERRERRKRISEASRSEAGGRVYRYRYTSGTRPLEERVAVPVPDAGIPLAWVEAAREALANNRRPANAGRRFWDLSGGILRCSECGRAMSARTALKQYFYYACTVGPAKRKPGCEAKKFHKAAELEEWVWGKLCSILTDPEKLRAGLEEMIERERQAMLGDPVKEASLLQKRLAKIAERRGRYQEMAAQDLIDFEELRERLAHLEEERIDTQSAYETIPRPQRTPREA